MTGGLWLERVSKTFHPGTSNARRALKDVTLSIAPGEFVIIIGSNGAGKSTLMNAVAGRIPVDRGRIVLDGVDITRWPEHRRAALIGRVFQDPMMGTAPSLSIAENMALAYRRGRRRVLRSFVGAKERALYREALATLELGLEARLETKVGALSGGERQALSLLMATFVEPKLLLLDEHTAALDPKRAELVLRLTEKIVREKRLTTLMITHNMAHALRMGDRLIMMHAGEIVLDLSAEEKAQMEIDDLLRAFERVRGEKFVDDRLVFSRLEGRDRAT
ncbi:MAG: ATP-binding cassette domain-containing protein [Hydrogenibacillus schlegelii]|nr:ATP-binding cassette domain-containing protein [Hydrogenibacillus schlegelii]